MPSKALPRDFYFQDTVDVARALLGCVLWRKDGDIVTAGRIVETEAYLGANDRASHARNALRTPRNESMYLEGGHAYVYLSYGMHWCMNVITQEEGLAEAVLIRAAQPVRGREIMQERRIKARREYDLMNGPGKVCGAMAIDRSLDGESLRSRRLWISERDVVVADDDIAVTPRIGVENSGDAAHWPLRFFFAGNRYVSAYRNPR